MTQDYAVTIKIRNNRLLAKMRECGYETPAALARASGVTYSTICKYLTLKQPPLSRWGRWYLAVTELANFLACLPEDLFPSAHIRSALLKNTAEFTANAADFQQISASLRAMALPADEKMMITESAQALNKLLDGLTPREKNVIEQRFGLIDGKEHAFNDISGEKCTVERVRQIQLKALRKLRRAAGNSKFIPSE
jgi:Sigma-70, region 4